MSTIDEAKQELQVTASGPTPKMEALIEAMYITAHADDDFGAKEREHFIANVVGICAGKVSAEDIKGVLLKLKGKQKAGREARLSTLAGRLPRPEDREHAFALSCTMAMADGVVLDEEKAFFDVLSQALGIEKSRANQILDELRALEPEDD